MTASFMQGALRDWPVVSPLYKGFVFVAVDGTKDLMVQTPNVGYISWDILKNVKKGSKLRTNLSVCA